MTGLKGGSKALFTVGVLALPIPRYEIFTRPDHRFINALIGDHSVRTSAGLSYLKKTFCADTKFQYLKKLLGSKAIGNIMRNTMYSRECCSVLPSRLITGVFILLAAFLIGTFSGQLFERLNRAPLSPLRPCEVVSTIN